MDFGADSLRPPLCLSRSRGRWGPRECFFSSPPRPYRWSSCARVCVARLSHLVGQKQNFVPARGASSLLCVRARLWCPAGPPAAGKAPYTMTACCTSLSFLVASERGPKTQTAHGPGSGRLGRRRLSGRRDLHALFPLESPAQRRHIRNGNISVQRTHIWLLWAALGRGGRLAVLGNCAHLCATPTQFALRTLRYAHLHFALRHLHQGPWRSRRLFATRPRRVGAPCGAFCGRPLPFSTGPLPPPPGPFVYKEGGFRWIIVLGAFLPLLCCVCFNYIIGISNQTIKDVCRHSQIIYTPLVILPTLQTTHAR